MLWTREHLLVHPSTGSEAFGYVPELKIKMGPTFPNGPIHLKYGEHRGAHRGFGFQHIWQEHYPHITSHDDAMELVIQEVAKALQPRAPLFFCEETPRRMEVLRLNSNSIIIELNVKTMTYSIVTAGFVRKYAKGSRVGALARVEP